MGALATVAIGRTAIELAVAADAMRVMAIGTLDMPLVVAACQTVAGGLLDSSQVGVTVFQACRVSKILAAFNEVGIPDVVVFTGVGVAGTRASLAEGIDRHPDCLLEFGPDVGYGASGSGGTTEYTVGGAGVALVASVFN